MTACRHISNEALASIVRASISWSDAIRRCGRVPWGASYQCFQNRVRRLGLDTSHFLGKAARAGSLQTGRAAKKEWRALLVQKTKSAGRCPCSQLRRAFREYCEEKGLPIVCSGCKNTGEWMNTVLKLEINHRNSCRSDNDPSNLEWLCPNCHSVKTYPA